MFQAASRPLAEQVEDQSVVGPRPDWLQVVLAPLQVKLAPLPLSPKAVRR